MRYVILILLVVFCGFVGFKMVTKQGAMLGVKSECGGWSTAGRVECDCKGKLEKSVCPTGTACDKGVDICYGFCGDCKCTDGLGNPVPCVTPTLSDFDIK